MFDKRNYLEHRCGRRLAIELPVTVFSRFNPPVVAQVRNLSRGGALIAPGARLFAHYTILYLDFSEPHRSERETAIPALVIHGGEQGVGVMFTQELSDAFYRYTIERKTSPSANAAAA